MILLSEYFSDDGMKTANITKQGLWFVAKLMENDKPIDYVTTFKEEVAETAAQEWVEGLQRPDKDKFFEKYSS